MRGWNLFLEPSAINLVLCAVCAIALGCQISSSTKIYVSAERIPEVKPVTAIAVIALPVIGSIVLLLLFFFLRIMQYLLLIALSIGAITSVSFLGQPFVDRVLALFDLFPRRRPEVSSGISIAVSIAATLTWTFTLSWPLSNFLAMCLGACCIAVTHMPSMRVCALLLGLFFVYDIFWVFLSDRIFGKSVMISVAQGLLPSAGSSFPALLTFPASIEGGSSILGMGDILLPGLFLAYLHRVDSIKSHIAATSIPQPRSKQWRIGYFIPSFVMYFVGLLVTFAVLVISGSGQPALLYLVPAVLVFPFVQSWNNREFLNLWKGAFEQRSRHHQQQQQPQPAPEVQPAQAALAPLEKVSTDSSAVVTTEPAAVVVKDAKEERPIVAKDS